MRVGVNPHHGVVYCVRTETKANFTVDYLKHHFRIYSSDYRIHIYETLRLLCHSMGVKNYHRHQHTREFIFHKLGLLFEGYERRIERLRLSVRWPQWSSSTRCICSDRLAVCVCAVEEFRLAFHTTRITTENHMKGIANVYTRKRRGQIQLVRSLPSRVEIFLLDVALFWRVVGAICGEFVMFCVEPTDWKLICLHSIGEKLV